MAARGGRLDRRRLARAVRSRAAVIYELHVGTFTPGGTFDSAIEKLDYLVDLGVDFVELMPVNAFGGTHGWGYDGVGWYAVHEPYGGPDGLVRFVNACHRRGLGVLIDAVFNHLGPSGNYLPRFGPYLSSGSNPWGESINISGADADEVRPLHPRLRVALDARLPRRRAPARRRARARRHHRHSHPRRAVRRNRSAGRGIGPAAVVDRRERPQRSPADHPPRPRRVRNDRAVGRRHPPRDPHRGVGRTTGLLRRFRIAGDAGGAR